MIVEVGFILPNDIHDVNMFWPISNSTLTQCTCTSHSLPHPSALIKPHACFNSPGIDAVEVKTGATCMS